MAISSKVSFALQVAAVSDSPLEAACDPDAFQRLQLLCHCACDTFIRGIEVPYWGVVKFVRDRHEDSPVRFKANDTSRHFIRP